MKLDYEIQKKVMECLKHVPNLNANEIGVAVKNGIVSLSGIVDSYPKKILIEKSVKRIEGVHGIAESISVHLSDKQDLTDSEIAQRVMDALHWHSAAETDRLSLLVESGVVTIDGTADWEYQRAHVTTIMKGISGLKGFVNNIKILNGPAPVEIKSKIEKAFLKNTHLHAENIHVDAEGSKVILHGTVGSQYEYEEAERSVWSTPGVTAIENDLEVEEHLV